MSEPIQKCNHQWLDFCEGSRCSRCGMVVNAIFYTKEDGVYTKDITPSPAPVAVSVGEIVKVLERLYNAVGAVEPADDNYKYAMSALRDAFAEAAALLARLKDGSNA